MAYRMKIPYPGGHSVEHKRGDEITKISDELYEMAKRDTEGRSLRIIEIK
jgi:hypothetical protein